MQVRQLLLQPHVLAVLQLQVVERRGVWLVARQAAAAPLVAHVCQQVMHRRDRGCHTGSSSASGSDACCECCRHGARRCVLLPQMGAASRELLAPAAAVEVCVRWE
jgi:hypothetical protein